MIAIQILLITGFMALLIVFLTNPRNLKMQAGKKILGILFVVTAIFFIIFPDISNDIARFVGVKRGADLLLYILTLSFIFVSLNFYLRVREEQNRMVKLARKVAILEANESKHNKQLIHERSKANT